MKTQENPFRQLESSTSGFAGDRPSTEGGRSRCLHLPTLSIAVLSILLALTAGSASAQPGEPTKEESEKEPVVELSPFQVVGETRGYFGSNTTAGTRLNSKIEDLGTSITVVTKELMEDFAMLDANDIFLYEASTEGTGNFTSQSRNQSGFLVDNVQLTPTEANRIRGLNPANRTFGNFETSGRIPMDPLNIDAVEISRGPNASLFGIGNGGGTINSVPASAHLTRKRSEAQFRVDSVGGYRTTLDLNRVLKPSVLAVRGSAALQRDGYKLKPSGIDSIRLNGMVKFQPRKGTTVTALYSTYKMHGKRPNSSTPADAISGWLESGAPTWDPVTRTVKVDGAPIGTFAGVPKDYFELTQAFLTSQLYVDQSGIAYWGLGRTTPSTTPVPARGSGHLMIASSDPEGFLAKQPLFNRPGVQNAELYDWSHTNVVSASRMEEDAGMAMVLIEQMLLNTPRHLLGLQAGWFHENHDRMYRTPLSVPGLAGTRGRNQPLQVDVNERMLDGTPNPFFLRPYIASSSPGTRITDFNRDTYRAELGYRLNLQDAKGRWAWLGTHQISAYAEYKQSEDLIHIFKDAIVSDHSWIPPGVSRTAAGPALGGLRPGPHMSLGFYNFYLGDNSGYNVEYGSTPYSLGNYTLNYGNPATGFTQENVELGSVQFQNIGTLSTLKTRGAIIQSHWLANRLITTFGWRHDQRFSRGKAPFSWLDDRVHIDPESDQWEDDWSSIGKGMTRTAGVVLKPLRWLSVYANRSNSFTPQNVRQDVNLKILPDPTGEGEDYGLMLNLFDGKLFVRLNQYRQIQEDRAGVSQILAHRLFALDMVPTAPNRLRNKATEWIAAEEADRGQPYSQDQFDQRLAELMKTSEEYATIPWPLEIPLGATDLVVAKGNEIELNYNPTRFWSAKLNITRQETINASLASDVWDWYEERLPIWESIIDPITGRPWFTERYENKASAEQILAQTIPLINVERQLEGMSRPQIREYRANLSTRLLLSGITDQRILKRFTIGGALRWEDKGSIGFYGVEQPPDIVTQLDASRPIYDKSHTYIDAFISYRTRIFSDKVGARIQLNVRNLNESGRLQPVSANPDGRPSGFRIIEPRRFILSVTLDL